MVKKYEPEEKVEKVAEKAKPVEKSEEKAAPEKTVTYVLGYNHDKMRQECGKCKGTQVLITETLFKAGPGGPDGKPTKVKNGFVFTCNDCKQTYNVLDKR